MIGREEEVSWEKKRQKTIGRRNTKEGKKSERKTGRGGSI